MEELRAVARIVDALELAQVSLRSRTCEHPTLIIPLPLALLWHAVRAAGVVLVQDGLHGGHARGEVPRDGGDGVIRGSHLADAARAPRVDHLPGGRACRQT